MPQVLVLATANTLLYTPSGGPEQVDIYNGGPNAITLTTDPTADPRGIAPPTATLTAVPSMRNIGTRLYGRAATADQTGAAGTWVRVTPLTRA
jgi:hypothetical protein